MVSKYHERGRSRKPRKSKIGYSSTMDSSDSFVQDLSPGGILDSLLVCAGIDTTTMDIYDFLDETEEEIKRSFRKAANDSTFDSEDYTLDSSRDDSRRHRKKSKSRSKKKKDKKKSRSKSRKKKDSRDSTSSSSSDDTRLANSKRDPPPRIPINPLLHPSMRNLNPVVNPVGMQQSPLLMQPFGTPLNMNSATPPGIPPGLSPIAPSVGVLPRHSSAMGLGQIPPQPTSYAQTLSNISPTRSVRSIDPIASTNLPGIHPRGISPTRSVRNFIDPSLDIGYNGVRPGERSLSPLARSMSRHHIPEMDISPMGLPPRAMGLRNERPPQRMMRPEAIRERRTSTSSGTMGATSEDTMSVPSRRRERSSSRRREKKSSQHRDRSSSRHRERSSSRRPDSRSSNMSSNVRVDERHHGNDRASSQSRVQKEPMVPVSGGIESHVGMGPNIAEENNPQTIKPKNHVMTQEEITEMIRKERIQQYRSATDLNNSNPALRNPKIMDRKLTDNTDLLETVIPPGELGMTIVKNSEGLTVVKLTDNAVAKDIRVGDVIVALDGVDITMFSSKVVMQLLQKRKFQNRNILYRRFKPMIAEGDKKVLTRKGIRENIMKNVDSKKGMMANQGIQRSSRSRSSTPLRSRDIEKLRTSFKEKQRSQRFQEHFVR
ncbi:predicted protein [Chaetoceros tenuissimus]|uniref:PDZ domain-containing protein n=1 Tax=Chaetoceros tenuissimus TaxID=426638 RepID=A0AAD3CSL9_9STRA|nr:predicted protein [Chaetoceros tenuissimus]